MNWTTLSFGKHKGKTLPQVLWSDPDWFFWMLQQGGFKGALAAEAAFLAPRATHIRIPCPPGRDFAADYSFHKRKGYFTGVRLVPRAEGDPDDLRLDVLDMSVVGRVARGDRTGHRLLLKDLKACLFGDPSYRMTKERCEAFFEDPANFASP